jgi:hypothetical protein
MCIFIPIIGSVSFQNYFWNYVSSALFLVRTGIFSRGTICLVARLQYTALYDSARTGNHFSRQRII